MSNIKINEVFQRIQYSATNGQTIFSIPFPFFSNAYVVVWQDGVVINQGAGAGQYGIAGAGSPSGGTITLVTPATLASIITIEGVMPIDRTSIYSATISNLTGSDLNGDFNREVVMMKQIETTQALLQLQYAPWTVISQDATVTKDRYIPLLPALGAWRMNAGGTAIETFLTPSSSGLAPNDAKYLLQVANSNLPNAQNMSSLASGFVANTTATGVQVSRIFQGTINQITFVNGDGVGGNAVVSISPNPNIPGVEGLGIPSGTTAQRPAVPVGTELRFNTDFIALEYWDNTKWAQLSDTVAVSSNIGTANQVLVNGGIIPVTGAVTISLSPTLNLPGTLNIQSSTAVNQIINDATLASATTSNLATALSIKNYIDTLVAGFNFLSPVDLASTAALNAAYANGASGVGATLINSGALAALTIDSVAAVVGNRILIKDQGSSLQNGIYTVTNIGSGATNWVLTRATDFDTPSEIQPGDLVTVLTGTANSLTMWLQTAKVATVGTDAIVFAEFGNAFSNVVTLSGIQTITGAKTFNANVVIGNASTFTLNASTAINAILNEGTLVSNSATAVPTQASVKTYVDTKTAKTNPTIQKFISGAGTYTTPTSPAPIYIQVVMVGGGGGGSGSGSASIGTGGNGGNTTFGTALLQANAGAGGAPGVGNGGLGGASSLGAGIGIGVDGGQGQGPGGTINTTGGQGGVSGLGGAGSGSFPGFAGASASTNSGSGGGGAGGGGGFGSGSGGGAGAYIDAIIQTPAASYAYSVGAAGAAGAAGTSGWAGGAGGAGQIIVFEYYQ